MNVIEVKNVHKSFKIHYDKGATLKEKLLFQNRNRYEEHQVLKGIDLTIQKGEVVGLIGENGCGKSTLLKLMTRIMYPDQGSIEVKGKVSSLLELGAGFHPDMSGRENIYTNASIFGLTKKEIDERLEEIIAFSELGEFINNPVRTYSSGMYMRLAFSVAINVDADILLIDEILAVGDAAFQAKCFNKMQEIKRQGTTIVIVSHDMSSIEKLCNRAIWINKGNKIKDASPHEVGCAYLDYVMNKQNVVDEVMQNESVTSEIQNVVAENSHVLFEEGKRWGNKEIVIEGVKILNIQGEEVNTIKTGETVTIQAKFKKNKDVKKFTFGVGINRIDGTLVYGTNTKIDRVDITHNQKGGVIEFEMEKCNLIAGQYYLDIAFESTDSVPLDYYCEAKYLSVYSSIGDLGIARIEHKWKVNGEELR